MPRISAILTAALLPLALTLTSTHADPAKPVDAPLPLIEIPAKPTDITPDLNHRYTLVSPNIFVNTSDNPGPASNVLGGYWDAANEFVYRTTLRNQYRLPADSCGLCADGYHIDVASLDSTNSLHLLVSRNPMQIQILPDPLLTLVHRTLAAPIILKRPDGNADQQPTGLNFDPILISTWQDNDIAAFPADKQKAKSALNKLADDKKIWALCALLDNPDIDLRIDAARSLQFIADPETAPALLAAAKANNYGVDGSENTTLHALYRAALKHALESTTGLSLTPRNLRKQMNTTDPKQPAFISSNDHPESFPEEIDFPKVDSWLRAHFLQPTVTELNQLLGQPFDAPAVKAFADLHDLKRYYKFDSGGYDNNEFLPVSLLYAESRICRIIIHFPNPDANTAPPYPDAARYTQPLPHGIAAGDTLDYIIELLGPPTTRTDHSLTYKHLNLTLAFSPEQHHLIELDIDTPQDDKKPLP